MRDARRIGSLLVLPRTAVLRSAWRRADDAIDESGRGAARRSGKRLTKRARLLSSARASRDDASSSSAATR